MVENVISLLRKADISAERAYPGGRMLALEEVTAAVSIAGWEQSTQTMRLLISVVAPAHLGGWVCEDRALEICALLATSGAKCIQGSCAYLTKADAFCVEVTAEFTGGE